MLAMKEGSLVWALNKDVTLVQKTYGVLLPQMLLLYSNEEDFHLNGEKPTKYFDLQRCLAIHPTDEYPDFFGIMLMIVPGGVDLLGCCTETERREWMDGLNNAIDTKIESSELHNFIDAILNRSKVPTGIADSYWSNSNAVYNLHQSPNYHNPNSTSESFLSPKGAQNISAISNVPRSNEVITFSSPPLNPLELPRPDTLTDFSNKSKAECCPKNCLNEVSEILDRVHPTLFNNTEGKNKGSLFQEKIINGYSNESPKEGNKTASEENIIGQLTSLNKMLISQEAANAILKESCDKLKDTLSILYDRLRLRGINVEPAFQNTGTRVPIRQQSSGSVPIQMAPCPLSSHESFDTISVKRLKKKYHRQPDKTASLNISEDEDEDFDSSTENSSFLGSGASSMLTLVAPNARTHSPLTKSSNQKVCAQCLKIVTTGILEVSMNIITSQAPSSLRTIQQVHNLTKILHSYLVGYISAIRSRTGLPNNVLITGLSKIALNNPNSPAIVRMLVESASAEVCGRILEDLGLLNGKKEENTIHFAKGLASDWFNSIPEKVDIQWMLPGYMTSCLLLYRLIENRGNTANEFDRSLKAIVTNENSSESQIEDGLEALSATLIHDICQVINNNSIESDPKLQLGQMFESMFCELLMKKFDKNALEVIMPEVTDNIPINPEKLFRSKLRSQGEMATSEEHHPSHTRGNENDNSFNKSRKEHSLTPCENNALDELEELPAQMLENCGNSHDRVQENHETLATEEVNRESNYSTNGTTASKTRYEEESQKLFQDIKQNEFHRNCYDACATESMLLTKDPHSQLNRSCPTRASNGNNDGTSNYSKLLLADAQETIHDHYLVLLDLVENATDTFTKFINITVDRQMDLDDEIDGTDFNETVARVPEALAGLKTVVNYLRARLFCDMDGEGNFVDGEGTSHEANLLSSEFGRLLSPQKTSPSPLGFTITLLEAEDPDEASESEI